MGMRIQNETKLTREPALLMVRDEFEVDKHMHMNFTGIIYHFRHINLETALRVTLRLYPTIEKASNSVVALTIEIEYIHHDLPLPPEKINR